MHYLRIARAVAFLILNVVQMVNLVQSTGYTVRKTFRKSR